MSQPRWQQAAAEFGNRIPAPLILIAALVILQVSSGMAKTIMSTENAAGLAFLRLALGTLMFWVVIRPPVRSFDRRQWIDAGMLGVVIAFFTLLIYIALTLMPIGLAVTIGFLGPLSVSLLKSRRPLDFLWPLMGFAGVWLLAPSTDGSDVTWQAMIIALIYAATWALYILASARAGKSMRGLDGFTVASAIGALILLPIGFTEAGYYLGSPYLVTMTLVVTVLITVPLGMEFLVLKRMEPRVFGVLLSLEPAIASVVGIVILQEFLAPNSWVAIAIVTAASIGVTLKPGGRAES